MNIKQIIKVYRIRDWLYFLGLPLLAYLLYKPYQPIYNIFPIFFLSFLLLAYAFSLNEVFDKNLNRKYLILPLLPLLILSVLIFIQILPRQILILAFLLIATSYSIPGIRLKSIPFICTFSNATGFSIFFLLGLNHITRDVLLLYFILFCFLFCAQLIHEASHREEDLKQQIITTAIYLNKKNMQIIIFLSIFIATLLSYLFFWAFGILVTLILIHITSYVIKNRNNFKYLRRILRWEGFLVGFFLLVYLFFR